MVPDTWIWPCPADSTRLTLRTQFRTYGFPLSSRYAPTPRFIFLELVSRLKASVTPRMGSGGPISTWDHHELKGKKKKLRIRLENWAGTCTNTARENLKGDLVFKPLEKVQAAVRELSRGKKPNSFMPHDLALHFMLQNGQRASVHCG